MDDDSSLVIHQFIDKYDDSSYTMSKNKVKGSKQVKKRPSKKSGRTPSKRKRKPKPPDMPRRPLSAYNLFFKEQRALIIGKPVSTESVSGISRIQVSQDGSGDDQPSFVRKKRAHRRTHGKISFADLAKQIGSAWNDLITQEKKKYTDEATKEKARYQEELRIYRLKKQKEQVEESEENAPGVQDRREISAPVPTSFVKRRKRYGKYSNDKSEQPTRFRDNPSGLTIEYASTKKPPSRLKGRRYRPVYRSNQIKQQEVDSIYPLPLSFDASRCHPSEIVNDQDMMQAVSPLLNHPAYSINQESCNDNKRFEKPLSAEDKSSLVPSLQITLSNVSAHSGNNSTKGPDNEMADILTFFLKDGDVDKNRSIDKPLEATNDNPVDIFAI